MKVLKKTISHQTTTIGLARFEARIASGKRSKMCRRMQRRHFIIPSILQYTATNGSITMVRSE
jgi:hypothetical protein